MFFNLSWDGEGLVGPHSSQKIYMQLIVDGGGKDIVSGVATGMVLMLL